MKWILPTTLFLALVSFTAKANTETDADKVSRAEIVAVIESFALGADTQDAERVGRTLHPQSAQYLPAAEGVRVFTRDQYLALLEAKKIGGQRREMTIGTVEVTEGYLAFASVQLRTDSLVFLHHFGLMKADGGWQIMSILTLAGKTK